MRRTRSANRNPNVKTHSLIPPLLCLVTVLPCSPIWSDPTATAGGVTSGPETANVVSVTDESIIAPRTADLAPDLVLGSASGTTWRSLDCLGRQPLFLITDDQEPTTGPNPGLIRAIEKAKTAVGAQVEFAYDLRQPASYPQIRFDYGTELKFGLAYSPPSFVAVDRAGFIRDIEPLPDSGADPTKTRLQFLLSTTPDPTPVLELGKPAPDFSFRDSAGYWHRVADLRGRKNLLLTFFPKCFTGGCAAHLSSLRDNFEGFIATNTEIWAASVDPGDGPDGQQAFAAHLGLPFPLLPDTGRNLSLLYGAVDTPQDRDHRQSILIDKDGIVRWIDHDVAPATHGVDVLAHIHALGLDQ